MLSEKPWRFDAILRLMIGLFFSLTVGMFVARWVHLRQEQIPHHEVLIFFVSVLSLHGMILLLGHFFLREHQLGWRDGFGFSHRPILRVILLGSLVSIAVLPIALVLTKASFHLLEWLGLNPKAQASVEMLMESKTWTEKIGLGVAVVIFAPFAEEVLFRGILYPAIKQRGFPRLALWGTAILFATIHFNLATFVSLMFLAVALTLLYEETDNLLAPVMAHGVFNGVNYAILISLPHLQ